MPRVHTNTVINPLVKCLRARSDRMEAGGEDHVHVCFNETNENHNHQPYQQDFEESISSVAVALENCSVSAEHHQISLCQLLKVRKLGLQDLFWPHREIIPDALDFLTGQDCLRLVCLNKSWRDEWDCDMIWIRCARHVFLRLPLLELTEVKARKLTVCR